MEEGFLPRWFPVGTENNLRGRLPKGCFPDSLRDTVLKLS